MHAGRLPLRRRGAALAVRAARSPFVATTTISPCSRKAAPSINPAARSFRAQAAPAPSASSISPSDNSPTSRVTRRAPRSLSGCRSQAGRRTMAGCPGKSTALAMMVAAASACDAVRASTVTASAMPSEKLRPWRPLVATPRAGSSASDDHGLHQARRVRPVRQAHGEVFAVGKMQRDVAAIVDISAHRAARSSVIAPRISSATAPATAAIGVMK